MRNKRGDSESTFSIWLVLGLIVFVILVIFLSKYLPDILEEITGIFDGVLLLFGYESGSSGPQNENFILGGQREIMLNDDGRCVVEINSDKYGLNFEEGVVLEKYGVVYSFPSGQGVNPATTYITYFGYLNKWMWSFDKIHWMDSSENVFYPDSLNDERYGEELIELHSRNISQLNGKSIEQGEEILDAISFISSDDEWLDVGAWIPGIERTRFEINYLGYVYTSAIHFQYSDGWEWGYSPQGEKDTFYWFDVNDILSSEDFNRFYPDDGSEFPLSSEGRIHYLNLAISLNDKDFIQGREILENSEYLITPITRGWRDVSDGNVFWVKQIKDTLDEVCL